MLFDVISHDTAEEIELKYVKMLGGRWITIDTNGVGYIYKHEPVLDKYGAFWDTEEKRRYLFDLAGNYTKYIRPGQKARIDEVLKQIVYTKQDIVGELIEYDCTEIETLKELEEDLKAAAYDLECAICHTEDDEQKQRFVHIIASIDAEWWKVHKLINRLKGREEDAL